MLDDELFEVHSGPRRICGSAVQTDADEVVLIDTGFPPKYIADAEGATAEDGLGSFGRVLSLAPDNLPEAQHSRLGLAKSDVTLMIQAIRISTTSAIWTAFPACRS